MRNSRILQKPRKRSVTFLTAAGERRDNQGAKARHPVVLWLLLGVGSGGTLRLDFVFVFAFLAVTAALAAKAYPRAIL
jgi:hypothetical protein